MKDQFYQKILLAVSVKLQILAQLYLQVALPAHLESFFNKDQQLPLQLVNIVVKMLPVRVRVKLVNWITFVHLITTHQD